MKGQQESKKQSVNNVLVNSNDNESSFGNIKLVIHRAIIPYFESQTIKNAINMKYLYIYHWFYCIIEINYDSSSLTNVFWYPFCKVSQDI